jgi:integrase/recombinase XerD
MVDIVDQKMRRLKALYINGKLLDNLELMISYIKYRRNTGLSQATIACDLKSLTELSKVITKPVKELTTDDIYEFFDCQNSKSKGAAKFYKVHAKGFFKYIGREDIAELCNVKKSSTDRKLPEDLLTSEDIELLIGSARTLRDKAYIAVLYESGARKGELEDLQLKHITFDENGAVVTLPKGKTGARRIRVVYAAGFLRNWLDNHPLKGDRDAWLWASSWDMTKRAESATMWYVLKNAAKKAGIKKRVNPHSFRHARATHLAKDLTEQQLKSYLGWTPGSNMAAVYVHLSGKDLDNAILKLNGLAIEEEPGSNAMKTIKCPRCKEIQDKKASFCFKCGMPLTQEAISIEKKADSELESLIEKKMAEMIEARVNGILGKMKG